MTAIQVADQLASLEAASTRERTAVNNAMAGVAQEHRSAYAAVTARATEMAQLSGGQALAIRQLEAEANELAGLYPEAARAKAAQAEQARGAAEVAIADLAQQAHNNLDILGATLHASVVPAESTDSTARQMARSEVADVLGEGGFSALQPLAALAASGDPVVASEALSPWAIRRLTAGLGERDARDLTAAYRALAVSLILDQPANRKTRVAIAALDRARAAIAADRQAAHLRLN